MHWIDTLRPALLLSLSGLFLLMLWRRFKQKTIMRDLPVAAHAELLSLHVEYHPERLRAEVLLPGAGELRTALLDDGHRAVHHWPSEERSPGTHVLELPLDGRPDGTYHFELSTETQRTVRRFVLARA